MHTLTRSLLAASLPLFFLPARAADAPPPVAVPAFLDEVKFTTHVDGEDHQLVATFGPGLLRIDEPKDGYSVIYNPATQFYTGLEHRNYTYWEFSWPAVSAAVQASKRAEDRLRDLSGDGLGDYTHPAGIDTNIVSDPSVPADSTPDYIWKPTTDRKQIAGIDCVRWVGDTPTSESIQAWCATNAPPQIAAALQQLRPVNEPMALVPVRVIVPPIVYGVFDALSKGGSVPLDITWGSDGDKNHFAFTGLQRREGRAALFTIPNLYNKTTLITMDGMLTPVKK
jgi:hypothetical protein